MQICLYLYTYDIFIILYILGFEKRVLREINILSLKLDDISEALSIAIRKKADEVQQLEHNEVPQIIQSFPVTENDLLKLENWLRNSEQNKTVLVRKKFCLSKKLIVLERPSILYLAYMKENIMSRNARLLFI